MSFSFQFSKTRFPCNFESPGTEGAGVQPWGWWGSEATCKQGRNNRLCKEVGTGSEKSYIREGFIIKALLYCLFPSILTLKEASPYLF